MGEQTLRIAVIGAGIGGLTAAMALRRAGMQVAVYEQAPVLREVGAGMHLAPNGTRLLHRFGLAGQLREVAVRPETLQVRLWNSGTVVARQPMGAAWESQFGAPHYTLHRADLHRILADQVPAQDIHLGKRCTAFTEDQDGVRIDFADGTTRHADLLIGADGVHSLVRQATAGPGHPQFAGTAAIRGVVPIEQVPDLPAQDMYVWTGPTSRMLACPVNAGRALAFVAVIPDTDTTHDSWSRHSDPTELRTAFTHWEPAVRHLVAAATQTGHWSLYDREPLTHWSTPAPPSSATPHTRCCPTTDKAQAKQSKTPSPSPPA